MILATLSWVHWYNTARLHSSLDYLTPIEHETTYYRQNGPRQQPLPGEPALHQNRGGSRGYLIPPLACRSLRREGREGVREGRLSVVPVGREGCVRVFRRE